MLHKRLLAVVVASALVAGCSNGSIENTSAIDQKQLCEVKAWQHDVAAEHCESGQKIVFLPQSFGNEQLPVIFAAVNCDLRYSVALTNGGVTCIYAPITPEPAPDEPTEPAASKSAE